MFAEYFLSDTRGTPYDLSSLFPGIYTDFRHPHPYHLPHSAFEVTPVILLCYHTPDHSFQPGSPLLPSSDFVEIFFHCHGAAFTSFPSLPRAHMASRSPLCGLLLRAAITYS